MYEPVELSHDLTNSSALVFKSLTGKLEQIRHFHNDDLHFENVL